MGGDAGLNVGFAGGGGTCEMQEPGQAGEAEVHLPKGAPSALLPPVEKAESGVLSRPQCPEDAPHAGFRSPQPKQSRLSCWHS